MTNLARDCKHVSESSNEDATQGLMLKLHIERGRSLLLVTGQSGSGKSYLLEQFIQTPPDYHHIISLNAANLRAAEDIKALLSEPNTVIVVDDAEELRREVLVELLTIAAYAEHEQDAGAVVLSGSLVLVSRVERWLEDYEHPINPIVMRVKPLNVKETRHYLKNRFNGELPFSEIQVKQIRHLSGGLPLRINRVAKQTLVDEVKALENRSVRPKKTIKKTHAMKPHLWKVASFAVLVMGLVLFVPYMKQFDSHVSYPTLQATTTVTEQPAVRIAQITPVLEPTVVAPAVTKVVEPAVVAPVVAKVVPPTIVAPRVEIVAKPTIVEQTKQVIVMAIAGAIPSPEVVSSYTHAERQLMQMQGYTLQLMGVHNVPTLNKLIERYQITNQSRIFRSKFMDQEWFVLTYGHYLTLEEAQKAIAALPEDMQALKPWVRPLNDVQTAIQQHNQHHEYATR